MLVAGDHEVGIAGNRALQNTVIRFVSGDGIHMDRGRDDLSNLGHKLEMPDDLAFLPLKPAENLGDLAHDDRGNQQDRPSFDCLLPNPKRRAFPVSEG